MQQQLAKLQFRQLFESVPGLYLILLPDLVITAVSDAYLEATLTKREEIIGKNLFEVFPDNPDDPGADGVSNLRASLQYVLKHKEQHVMAIQKYDVRRPDGSFEERYWSPLNKPMLDDNNEIICIIHRAENITSFMQLKKQQATQQQMAEQMKIRLEEVEAEVYKRAQETEQVNGFLRNEVKERKLVEAALQQQTLQLEKANNELEAFSYSVSHDLRAPLRIIDGYTGIIMSDYADQLDAEGRRMLGIVASNVQKMGQLIDDLLNLSQLGRKELLMNNVDMNRLLEPIIADYSTYKGKPVAIQVNPLAPAICDSSLLRQVWINLVSNAAKYSSNNEAPRVEIASVSSPHEIIYSVRDNGVGFNMKYVDKLFGVFQRLHKMEEFEGTGVGLALVQRIVSRHGGKVWAEAELGKGACFYFSLPVTPIQHQSK